MLTDVDAINSESGLETDLQQNIIEIVESSNFDSESNNDDRG